MLLAALDLFVAAGPQSGFLWRLQSSLWRHPPFNFRSFSQRPLFRQLVIGRLPSDGRSNFRAFTDTDGMSKLSFGLSFSSLSDLCLLCLLCLLCPFCLLCVGSLLGNLFRPNWSASQPSLSMAAPLRQGRRQSPPPGWKRHKHAVLRLTQSRLQAS